MVIRKNNRSRFIRLAVIIIVATTLAVLAAVWHSNTNRQKPTESILPSTPTVLKKVTPRHYSTPTRLIISKLAVNTTVEQMGLTSSGNMEAPATDAASGWYKNGPNPGNPGSAVIAGHLGVNSRAVFSDLGSLVKGDKVFVTDSSNQTATFAVTHIRRYKNNANPSEVFTSTSGSHLNLITCEGEWEPNQATYSERLVVFTDKVEQ